MCVRTYSALAQKLAVAPALPVEQFVESLVVLAEEARQLLPEVRTVSKEP